jgi:hypothetical protein
VLATPAGWLTGALRRAPTATGKMSKSVERRLPARRPAPRSTARLSFVDADIMLYPPSQELLAEWKARPHMAGTSSRVIIDGDPQGRTNAERVRHVLSRHREVMTAPTLRPDQVIFQSSVPGPTRVLSEDQAETFDYVVQQPLGVQ